jgi:hypothetical protein
MPRKKTLIDKKTKKRIEGKCHFCGNDDYAVLDCHRIVPGEDDGKYTEVNTVVACANCHRKIHDGQIELDRKYFTSAGRYVLHYWENGEEKWE